MGKENSPEPKNGKSCPISSSIEMLTTSKSKNKKTWPRSRQKKMPTRLKILLKMTMLIGMINRTLVLKILLIMIGRMKLVMTNRIGLLKVLLLSNGLKINGKIYDLYENLKKFRKTWFFFLIFEIRKYKWI